MAIKVTLRKKGITKGRETLYLDFYPAIEHPNTGKLTRREFLKMYLHEKPRTEIEKTHNREQQKLAELIRQQRENTINKPEIYSRHEREQLRLKELGEQDFVEYFRKQAIKRNNKSNVGNWFSALQYLERYTGGKLKFSELTLTKLEDFRDFLLDTTTIRSKKLKLSQNSAASYFNKVKATLRQAYQDGFLTVDLNARLKRIKEQETQKEFLTIEELNKLLKTHCPDDVLKRSAIFSAITGLRFSDVKNLIWKDIFYIEGHGYFVNYRQQKTKVLEIQPISEQAVEICGQKGEPTQSVFQGLRYSAYHRRSLKKWLVDAGINKNITFHSSRHTFATLQLNNGTDIYSVSKLLGHKNIKTTQGYAKLVDSTLRKTVDRIKLDL
jgi:integrase